VKTALGIASWLRQKGGRASFTEFMAAALYAPGTGYYTQNVSGVGKGGDFATSATLHPILGAAVAGWIRSQWDRLGVLPVIEIGAGDGSLAASVLAALPWWKRWGVKYHIVDVSPPLVALQKAKLKDRKITWHDSVKGALAACDGKALLFSNELADAFPCRLLMKSVRGWDEIYLRMRADGFEEEREELHPEVWSEWSACSEEHMWRPGQRVEVQESYFEWLKGWVPKWAEGAMLTVDYGAEVSRLYWRRPGGTLRAYFAHLRLEGSDIYARMGQQDLTVDVNFTDLRNWGEALGLETLEEAAQREFVERYAGDYLKKSANHEAVKYLQDSEGAGEAFRILAQEKKA